MFFTARLGISPNDRAVLFLELKAGAENLTNEHREGNGPFFKVW